ncbi:MAG: NYN domain-containing protein [Ignavibacteria bacterium]|nr:NYN domain-containing protein [Ignavibacteria bacterium]
MSSENIIKKQRVIIYIDGFNLYFGLKEKGWKKFYWLNIRMLSENILNKEQKLLEVKYFTSRVSFPPEKVKRQVTFIEALETLPNVKIYYGNYQANKTECKNCGYISMIPNEKMTDVNIAVELLSDAYENKFDTAILVSADSDLIAPIKTIKRLFKEKRIVVAFPPARHSFALKEVASASFTIGRKKLADSLFPDEVIKSNGYILKRPTRWI